MWIKPEIEGQDSFCHKRFHTASTVGTKIVTFGGCHSEYVHLNDLNIFELDNWLIDSTKPIICSKVPSSQVSPSTRWGHSAAVNNNQLLILGGRNDADINDIYSFDLETQIWSQLEVGHPLPKPRRRHSCIFISNCLVMFGGFDGEFYNDLNVMDISQMGSKLEREVEFINLVDSEESHDITFRLYDTQ
jgi:N-acetylneuraminic acid mutarotase